jgi:hypothetical protein
VFNKRKSFAEMPFLEVSFSNPVKRLHPNFKILLAYCQISNLDCFFMHCTDMAGKRDSKQGTILESSVLFTA